MTYVRARTLFRSLLCIAWLAATPAWANNDAYWLEAETRVNHDPDKVWHVSDRARLAARQAGDKPALLHAIRLQVTAGGILNRQEPLVRELIGQGIALARELGDIDTLCALLGKQAWFLALDPRTKEQSAPVLDEAIALAERHGLRRRLGHLYLTGADINHSFRWSADGLEMAQKAYGIFESVKDPLGLSRTLMILGEYQHDTGYYRKALEAIDPDVHRAQTSEILIELGATQFAEELHKKMALPVRIQYLLKALALQKELKFDDTFIIHHSLGWYLSNEKRYAEALQYYETALEEAGKFATSTTMMIATLLRMAEIHSELGKKQESLNALARAKALLPMNSSLDAEGEYYAVASILHEHFGDHKSALADLRTHNEKYEKWRKEAGLDKQKELKTRFGVQLKEAENAALRAQRSEGETRQLLMMLTLAFSLSLFAGIGLYLRKRAMTAKAEAAHHQALAAAEARANQAKSAFLANISHELRTPLNAMLGFSRLLVRSPDLPQPARDDIGIVLKSGEHLYTLINEVLDLSRIEAGQAVLLEKGFDLYALLDELEDIFALAARQKGVELAIANAADVPRHVVGDALKLRQVLMNLIGNALKFTERGRIALQVLAPEKDPWRLSFTVSDTGVGIAPGELEKLGQAFVQAQAGLQAHEGTGLGLAISRGFVQLMDGDMRLESEPGRGTTVTVRIPLRIGEPSAEIGAEYSACRATALAPSQPRYRILVADDLPESRHLLVRLLAPLGFEVREAENGARAVALCASWRPHLVWMDMRMPVMDGREATRRIREAEQDWHAVIIALTASSYEEEREQILALGCDDFLRKPFREDALFALMHKHLGAEFIHDDASAHDANAVSSHAASLPSELRHRLVEALVLLDETAIDAVIQETRQLDGALADTLSDMAGRFDYDRILQLLEHAPAPEENVQAG